jgi:hypothetical protein
VRKKKRAEEARQASASGLLLDQDQEKLTMQQRIDAFYRQSGGPNNPQIKKVLERHLLYGKDHGAPGRKETVMDAFTDTIMGDPLLLMLFQQWNNRRMNQASASKAGISTAEAETIRQLQRDVLQLKSEMGALRELLEQIAANVEPPRSAVAERVD